MATYPTISAQPRTEFGKGFARRLRAAGQVPGVIYGADIESPIHFSVDILELHALLRAHGSNAVLDLDIEGEKHLTMVKHVDQNVLTLNADHVDLLAIKRGEKVEVEVPVALQGETAPGTTLIQDADTVLVEADVLSIPEEIAFSVEGLEVDAKVLAGDLSSQQTPLWLLTLSSSLPPFPSKRLQKSLRSPLRAKLLSLQKPRAKSKTFYLHTKPAHIFVGWFFAATIGSCDFAFSHRRPRKPRPTVRNNPPQRGLYGNRRATHPHLSHARKAQPT